MIHVPPEALKPQIRLFSFSEDQFQERVLNNTDELTQMVSDKSSSVFWIDIMGLGDKQMLEKIAGIFGLHKLQMEDVVNVYQRPKLEDCGDYMFFITRLIREAEEQVVNEQMSLFIGRNYLISLQESHDPSLDPVRNRLREGKGIIRKSGSSYLAYALMDTALDHYFPVLEKLSDQLDNLQDELIANPTREALNQVLQIKRELIVFRRTIWSERDKLNDILRNNYNLISAQSMIYFRDTYDHCIQILELTESYKEVTASLMDVYHSSVSNKLNQVMKVLTIISTIFIPLTFIVGVYGMNFARVNPETGEVLKYNMPELYSPYGYLLVGVFMTIVVVLQVIFFIKKGWLGRS